MEHISNVQIREENRRVGNAPHLINGLPGDRERRTTRVDAREDIRKMGEASGPMRGEEFPSTPLASTMSKGNAARVPDMALDEALDELGDLLQKLEYDSDGATDNLLVRKRLGIAGSLFVALKSRHAAAGSHSPPGVFLVSLRFSQEKQELEQPKRLCSARVLQVFVFVRITARNREKATHQRGLMTDRARHLLRSLRSYLMATSPEVGETNSEERETEGITLS